MSIIIIWNNNFSNGESINYKQKLFLFLCSSLYIVLCINIAVISKINNILHDDYQPQHEISEYIIN